MRALSALSGPAGYVTLYRFAGSAVHAAAVVEGTAGCQRFEFFTVAPDGHADVVDAPDVIRNAKEGSMMLCGGFGSLGWTGDVGGEPVFVIEDGKDQREEITITPWRDDAWQQACTVAIRFSTPLTIDAHYCRDVDCAKVGALARALAMQFDKDPDSLPRAEARPELSGPAELPTFDQAKGNIPTFAEEAAAISVSFEGKAYVARLGHAAIGWRRYPDYLFALYRPVGDEFQPVAGIVIGKKRDKPVEVTVK